MKVLIINGSPHAEGNTAAALNEMIKIFDAEGVEVKLVQVGNKAVRGCVACGKCEKRCKANCINLEDKSIDGSRCVMCFNCLGHCKQGAIKIDRKGVKAIKDPNALNDPSRRKFLAVTATVGLHTVGTSSVCPAIISIPYDSALLANESVIRLSSASSLCSGIRIAVDTAKGSPPAAITLLIALSRAYISFPL